jgi:hypothetical protein
MPYEIDEDNIHLILSKKTPTGAYAFLGHHGQIRQVGMIDDFGIFHLSKQILHLVAHNQNFFPPPTTISQDDLRAYIRHNLCILIDGHANIDIELSSNGLQVSSFATNTVILRNTKIEKMVIKRSDSDERLKIYGEGSQISILFTDIHQFMPNQIFPGSPGVSIGAIIHKTTEFPNSEQSTTAFSMRDLTFSYLYSDAQAISISNIDLPFILCHPQPTSAIFNFKSVRLTFNRVLISKFVRIRGAIREKQYISSYWTFYAGQSEANIEAEFSMIDLASRKNAQMAELTLKHMHENSSLMITAEAYGRMLYFFNTRGSSFRRLLYWFNGAYFNIFLPLLGAILFLTILAAALFYERRALSDLTYIIDPKSLISDFLFEAGRSSMASYGLRIGFMLTLALFYYSIACLFLALKRRFGFPNELR